MDDGKQFVRKFKHEELDWKWVHYFFDFFSLLDDETRAKYPVKGLAMLQCGCEGRPTVRIGDTLYGLLTESTVYRAMAAICEAEGDFYLALACLMSVKACLPNLSPTPTTSEITRLREQTKFVDRLIEDMKKKLPYTRRDILKEWINHVR